MQSSHSLNIFEIDTYLQVGRTLIFADNEGKAIDCFRVVVGCYGYAKVIESITREWHNGRNAKGGHISNIDFMVNYPGDISEHLTEGRLYSSI